MPIRIIYTNNDLDSVYNRIMAEVDQKHHNKPSQLSNRPLTEAERKRISRNADGAIGGGFRSGKDVG